MSNASLRVPKYLEITDNKNLIRDTKSHAVINTDITDYLKRKTARDRRLKEKEEFEQLKSDVKDIKALLEKLVNKND